MSFEQYKFFLSESYQGDNNQNVGLSSGASNQNDNKGNVYPIELPVVPLRNIVLFPGIVTPLSIGRQKSVAAVEESSLGNKYIGLIAQKSKDVEDPGKDDLYQFGVVASIFKIFRLPDNSINIVVRVDTRFKIKEILSFDPFIKVSVEYLELNKDLSEKDIEVYEKTIKDMAISLIKLIPDTPPDMEYIIQGIEQPELLAYFVASGVNASIEEKQQMLEESSLKSLFERVISYLGRDLEFTKISKNIQDKVKDDVEKGQREFFLRQQLKAIQK